MLFLSFINQRVSIRCKLSVFSKINKDFSDYIRSIEALDENIDKAEMYAKSIYHLEAIRNSISNPEGSLAMWKNNLELIAVTEMRNSVTNLINTLKTGLSSLLKE